MLLYCLIIYVVPTPKVNFSRLPNPPYYEGAQLSLTCLMELHKAVDIDVMVSALWRHGDDAIESSDRVSLLDHTEFEDNSQIYSMSVTFDPLSSLDGGQYVCEFRVLPDFLTEFVLPSSGIATSERIIVQGKQPNRTVLSTS